MKSRLFKTCSWILVIVMLINLLPAQIIALELQAEDVAAPVTSEQVNESAAESKETAVDISNATILMELVENRTEFSKEYKLSNGMNMAIVYPEAVHYKKDGQWKDIDNTLQSKGSGDTAAYATTAGAWHAEFPQQLRDGAQVTITKNGYTVGFEMIGEVKPSTNAGKLQTTTLTAISEVRGQVRELDYSKQKEQAQHPEIVRDKLKSRMSYSNVFTNTDIVYDVTSSQVKESIVISQYNASVCGYLYILDTGTLVPVLNTDNSIDLLVPNSTEVVMTMPAPFMVDNAGSLATM